MNAILIVDDEFVILESLRIQIMRMISPEVILEAASSATEALEIIRDFQGRGYSLVLTISDYNLDDGKGTDVLGFVHQCFPEAHKAILSGQSDIQALEEFKARFGLDAIFSKPWDFHEVNKLVEVSLTL